METFDTLRPDNEVTVKIWGPENVLIYEGTSTGHHKIEEAIKEALEKTESNINPEDYVFEVTNNTTGVSHKYRFNAHGHLKLII